MVVALIALVVAIGGTAAALPGKFTVGRDDLRSGSVGARALGSMYMGKSLVLKSEDPVPNDGQFTESIGTITCPAKAPTAIDPFIAGLGRSAFELNRSAVANRFGGPAGYRFTVTGDDGPDVGYTMTVNCLFAR
jgi:hypothetical protein